MTTVKPLADPYRTLGVVRGANLDQVKAAHRQLAKLYHPDGSTGNEKRFLEVQEAYQLLSNPLRRIEWDRSHAPGPVHADGPVPGGSRGRRARPTGQSTDQGGGSGASAARAATRPARPARDGRSRSRTWSAERVPWWEDFRPGSRTQATDPEPPNDAQASNPDSTAPRDDRVPTQPSSATRDDDHGPVVDFDVFSRSSGAAWSMAARRHFRKGDEDLPSRGAWRYRGTQVVTGGEARKVAEEEAAAEDARQKRSTRRVDVDRPGDPEAK